jgi:hypothetical protein
MHCGFTFALEKLAHEAAGENARVARTHAGRQARQEADTHLPAEHLRQTRATLSASSPATHVRVVTNSGSEVSTPTPSTKAFAAHAESGCAFWDGARRAHRARRPWCRACMSRRTTSAPRPRRGRCPARMHAVGYRRVAAYCCCTLTATAVTSVVPRSAALAEDTSCTVVEKSRRAVLRTRARAPRSRGRSGREAAAAAAAGAER